MQGGKNTSVLIPAHALLALRYRILLVGFHFGNATTWTLRNVTAVPCICVSPDAPTGLSHPKWRLSNQTGFRPLPTLALLTLFWTCARLCSALRSLERPWRFSILVLPGRYGPGLPAYCVWMVESGSMFLEGAQAAEVSLGLESTDITRTKRHRAGTLI